MKRSAEQITCDQHSLFMGIAYFVAELSDCEKRKVGSVIVDSNTHDIVSTGYNKRYSTHEECCEQCLNECGKCDSTTHAEIDALLNLCKLRTSNIESLIIYVTYEPCTSCQKFIRDTGVKKVIYHQQKRNELEEFHFKETHFKHLHTTPRQFSLLMQTMREYNANNSK